MANFESIASSKSKALKEAARIDLAGRRQGLQESSSALKGRISQSATVEVLREIEKDLSSYNSTDRDEVVKKIVEKLNKLPAWRFRIALKESSNQEFMQMTSYWFDFLSEIEDSP